MQRTIIQLGLLLLCLSFQLSASGPTTGPLIKNYGPVFAVPDGSFNLLSNQDYKILMDIGKGPDDPAELNRRIESAARFLNLHARNGIKPKNLKLAIVLHGSAVHAALNDEAYEEHFLVENANKKLIVELKNAGVDVYICGQSAAYNGYAPQELLAEITMAVSAMTVHVRLQQEGYQAILF
jgi:intracellular sulfur oxidation DsrE/DsrF family protein